MEPDQVITTGCSTETETIHQKYADLRGEILVVELKKGPNGLGISLVGNKDRTKMSVFVCGINPNGSAARDGRVQIGDELLEVNGIVVHGRCHLNASAMIKLQPGPTYRLVILRRENSLNEMAIKPLTQFPLLLGDESTGERYSDIRTITVKKGNHGLGIMIIEGKHTEAGQGIFVSNVQEGSPAYQAGLAVGDMIHSVNDSVLIGTDYETASWILKQAKGNIQLVVSNPKRSSEDGLILEEGKRTYSEAFSEIREKAVPTPKHSFLFSKLSFRTRTNPLSSAISSLSRLSSPSPTSTTTTPISQTCILEDCSSTSSSSQDLTQNPRTCEIVPGRGTTIEIIKEKIGLGLSIIGGYDTPLRTVLIHEIYPDGAAAVDGRLKPGDHIREVNGENLRYATREKAITALRQTPSTVRMTVYREEGLDDDGGNIFDVIEVDLLKKSGRGLGLSIVGKKSGPGVFISDVIKGGAAEADGRLTQGDYILEVNGHNLRDATQETAAAVLKTTVGRVCLKIGRLKSGTHRRTISKVVTNAKRNDTSDPSLRLKAIRLLRGPNG
ncbi:multiple PDZ domain protein-like [Tachypleus tridentatus]|uniref:multiple PDZ domain protein-like n=1 Tax=Tachypleus tridentatus TaxID=6853 RepID=UPI003FCFA153